MAERLSGIGIAYPRACGETTIGGTRMPDIDCRGIRFYEVLRSGRFLLVTGPQATPGGDWPGVDHAVHHEPALPAAILVRPDGYVAWATRGVPDTAQLSAVLTRWSGPRTKAACDAP